MTASIEQQYQSRMDALTTVQRVERCAAMFQWTREMIGRQIVAELGPMSAERLKWEVAKRLYAADPVVVGWIEQRLADILDAEQAPAILNAPDEIA